MKKIFTLAAILFSITAFAAEHPGPRSGKVSIKSGSDEFLQVVINGKQYNVHCNGFVMDNLRPGRHYIEVYEVSRRGSFRRRPHMIYSNTVFVRPWESLDININRSERVWVQSRSANDGRFDGNGRGYGNDNDRNRDYDHGHDHDNRNDRYGNR